MDEIFTGLSGRQKLLIIILVIAVGTTSVAVFTAGFRSGILVAVVLLAVLWITKEVWAPEETASSTIAKGSLAVVTALAPAYIALPDRVKWTIWQFLASNSGGMLPDASPRAHLEALPGAIFLMFAYLTIFTVNFLVSRSPATGLAPSPRDPELRKRTFRQQRDSFCRQLMTDLDRIDDETRWSGHYFVPLDAEVRILSTVKRARKLQDLLIAIRRNKSDKIFVVLGDPGSGKSVALRTLCQQLIKQAMEVVGKIPLYVNLKEWTASSAWTRDRRPAPEDFEEFLVLNLKRRLSVFGSNFIESYYRTMLQNGMFFFVLDSFDEIPAILDVDDSSWLVEALSGLFETFFFGAYPISGVLASRFFRRPRLGREDRVCTLEVRPFTEMKIAAAFGRYAHVRKDLLHEMLTARPDLISAARNPFTAGLVIDFLKQPNSQLPRQLTEIYRSYVDRRLESVQDILEECGISKGVVVQNAVSIAGLMLNSGNLGLEIPISDIAARLQLSNVASVIEVLVAARIGRCSGAGRSRFSFVHRRFNEYFFVHDLLMQGGVQSLAAIPTDGKWRDSLVLYSEVCSEQEAERIAKFCWKEMQDRPLSAEGKHEDYIRHVHCLRFLNEAFRNRTVAVKDFADGLFSYVLHAVQTHKSLLFRKIAVEAVGLLRPSEVETVVLSALEVENGWVTESALNACRYLALPSRQTILRLAHRLADYPVATTLGQRREISFALSLSPSMKPVLNFWRGRIADCMLYLTVLCVLTIVYPPFAVASLLVYASLEMVYASLEMAPPRRASGEATDVVERRRDQASMFFLRPLRSRIWSLNAARFASLFVAIEGFPVMAVALSPHALHRIDTFSQARSVLNDLMPLAGIVMGPHWTYVAGLCLSAFLAPLYQIPIRIKFNNWSLTRVASALLSVIRSISLNSALKYLGVPAAGIACMALLIVLTEQFTSQWFLDMFVGYILLLFGFIFIAAASITWVRWLRRKLHDRRVLRDAPAPLGQVARDEIERVLNLVQLTSSRLQYLHTVHDAGTEAIGQWSRGLPPSFSNDAAGTLLAQLEARWLGIER